MHEGYRVGDVFHIEDADEHVHELTVPNLIMEVVSTTVHRLL